jgi:HPt (histidine-containing phosphotransfer) domain-containing protein
MITEPRLSAELVTLYLQDIATNFAELTAQFKSSDPRLIRNTLHTMKGSCRQVGALSLGDLIERMEGRLHASGIDATRPGIHELLKSFALLRSEMEQYLSSHEEVDS